MHNNRQMARMESYENLVGAETVERIQKKAWALKDLHVVNINFRIPTSA